MLEITLKKKKVGLGTRAYKLTKSQFKSLISKNREDNTKDLKIFENLVFYSFDYGYCLIRKKIDKPLNNEEVWLVECFLERDRIYETYLSEKQINKLISYNTEIQNDNTKTPRYLVSHFKAILD